MTEGTEPVLLEETKGHVRILTLNRPAKKNALSDDLMQGHPRDDLALARRALTSEDGREAVEAIFEKRKPALTGT